MKAKFYSCLASFAVMLAVFSAIQPMCWLTWHELDIPQSLKK